MSVQPSQFDSHRFVKRLTNAGLSEEVAEILADEHASRIIPADVATKSDIAATQSDIAATKSEVAATRAEFALAVVELKELIVATQRSTLRWMFGMLVAFTGIVFAAMANFR